MSDMEVSNTQVLGTFKKRKAKETDDVDGERRKKRKRTPHGTKRNKDKDMKSEVNPEITVSTDPINDESLSTVRSKESNSSLKKKSRDVVELEVEVRNSNSAQNEEKAVQKEAKTQKSLPDRDIVPKPPTEEVEPEQVPEKKLKKQKKEKKDEYPDPRKDNALSESETALKALTYVHERLTSHSEWKFNKARQNWVLRNIWDENAIPEVYVPSCVKYLKGVQGNSRNVLIKECNSILEEDIKTEPAKTEGTVRFQEPSEPKAKNEVKISRAQAILKKLTK